MYICPTCNKKFEYEDDIAKHSLKCWKEHNPNHKSKSAPHSADIIQKEINEDIANFFAFLQRS